MRMLQMKELRNFVYALFIATPAKWEKGPYFLVDILYCFILFLYFLHKLLCHCEWKSTNKVQFHQNKACATVLIPETFKTTRNNTFFSRKSIQNKESIDATHILIFPCSLLFLSVIKIFHNFKSVLDSWVVGFFFFFSKTLQYGCTCTIMEVIFFYLTYLFKGM